ncbi:MAG: T9SS type A sorting domain-containing protein, partial [Salibacteraceae bacterium]
DELGKEVNALIFPNPAQYQLNIQITGLPNLPLQLELMDLQGRAVLSRQYVGSTINEQLELEGLPSGTYLLRLTNRNGTLTERIVVR